MAGRRVPPVLTRLRRRRRACVRRRVGRRCRLRRREVRAPRSTQAREHLKTLNIGIPSVRQRVDTLSGGQRQAVAVARAPAFGRDIVIMDEPTAALGVKETAAVMNMIRRINEHGLAIILVSHNLPRSSNCPIASW